MRALRIPAPVRAGARIRVISPTAPSAAFLVERANRGVAALASLGFAVSYGANALGTSTDGLTAADPAARAEDFVAAFEDPDVDAVLSADAGSGTVDLLDHLDAARIAAHPKPFIGFCDNVHLNQFLASEAGISSLYGPTLIASLGEAGGAFPETLHYLRHALDSAKPLTCVPVGDRSGEWINWYLPEMDSRPRRRCVPGGWTWLRPGTARGALLGGEVTVIPKLARRFGLRFDNRVLFWHKAFRGAEPEPKFRDLCRRVDLTGLAGMIVGAHPAIPPPQWAARVADLVDELLPGTTFPVVVNADISHLCPAWTVPFGEDVVLDSCAAIEFPRTVAA